MWIHIPLWYHIYCISNNVNNIGILNSVNHDAKSCLESPKLYNHPNSDEVKLLKQAFVFWDYAVILCKLQSSIYTLLLLLQHFQKPHYWYKWRKMRLLLAVDIIIPERDFYLLICLFYLSEALFQKSKSSTPVVLTRHAPEE